MFNTDEIDRIGCCHNKFMGFNIITILLTKEKIKHRCLTGVYNPKYVCFKGKRNQTLSVKL